jgi:hypothetical protein
MTRVTVRDEEIFNIVITRSFTLTEPLGISTDQWSHLHPGSGTSYLTSCTAVVLATSPTRSENIMSLTQEQQSCWSHLRSGAGTSCLTIAWDNGHLGAGTFCHTSVILSSKSHLLRLASGTVSTSSRPHLCQGSHISCLTSRTAVLPRRLFIPALQ